jgi:amino acid adenylation domain-containing protein
MNIKLSDSFIKDNHLFILSKKIKRLLFRIKDNNSHIVLINCNKLDNSLASYLAIRELNKIVIPVPINFNDKLLVELIDRYNPYSIITDIELKIDQKLEIINISDLGEESVCYENTYEVAQKSNPYSISIFYDELLQLSGVSLTDSYYKKIVDFLKDSLKINLNDLFILGNPKLFFDLPIWLEPLNNGADFEIFTDMKVCQRQFDKETLFLHVSDLFNIVENEGFESLFSTEVKHIITIGSNLPDSNIDGFLSFLKSNEIKWFNILPSLNSVFITNVLRDSSSDLYVHAGYPIKGEQIAVIDNRNKIQPLGVRGNIFSTSLITDAFQDKSKGRLKVEIGGRDFWDVDFEGVQKIDKKYYFTKSKSVKFDFWYDLNVHFIEQILKKNEEISEFFILANEDKELFTVFVSSNPEVQIEGITKYLNDILPYKTEINWGIVRLKNLPKDKNGFIDEKKLSNLKVLSSYDLLKIKHSINSNYPEYEIMIGFDELDIDSAVTNNILEDEVELTINETIQQNLNTKYSVKAYQKGEEIKEIQNTPLTLDELLYNAVRNNPKEEIICIDENGEKTVLNYEIILTKAQIVSQEFYSLGFKPKDKIIIHVKDLHNFFIAFWGSIIGGFVPVPIGVFKSYEKDSNELVSLKNIWDLLDKPLVITEDVYLNPLKNQIENLKTVNIDKLSFVDAKETKYKADENDISMILFTSGSTGVPKGVTLSHKNLISREKAIIQLHKLKSDLISVNWMPIEHSAGLFMLHLKQTLLASKQVHCRPEYILKNPLNWLDLLSDFKANFTFAPNFAYSLVTEVLKKRKNKDWDFTSLKMIVNAAEMVNADTSKGFLEKLVPFNLSPKVMYPVWGMSETCAGALFSYVFELGTDKGVNRINKESLRAIVEKTNNSNNCITFVEIGKPIPGFEVRIVDDHNEVIEERRIGRLQVKGPQVISGYYNNDEVNKEVFLDGWMDTGDLAFIMDGAVTMTGRAKDVIIINGINYNNNEIETLIEREISDLELTYTVACAVKVNNSGTEKLCVFYCPRNSIKETNPPLKKRIEKFLLTKMGLKADYVIPMKKEDIPKTSLGKLQRIKLARRFENGEINNGDNLQKVTICIKESDKNTISNVFDVLQNEELINPELDLKFKVVQKANASDEVIIKELSVKEIFKHDQDENRTQLKKLDEIDLKVLSICQEILEIDQISMDDNYFELGGNSLNSTVLVFQLRSRFNVNISISEIFQFNNLKEIADFVKFNNHESELIELPKYEPDLINASEPFPLTEIQISYLLGRSSAMEIGGVSTQSYQEIPGKMDITKLNIALNKIIERHSMLRTIILENGQQKILREIPKYEIKVDDISGYSVEQQKERIGEERKRMSGNIFNSSKWPLFEINCFLTSEEDTVLCVSFDMLIMDGHSMSIVSNDLYNYYNAPQVCLPTIEFSFRDYVNAYHKTRQTDLYQKAKDYWLTKLEEFPLSLDLPLEKDPAKVTAPNFKVETRIVSKTVWQKLKKLARKRNLTPVSLLCTAYSEVLAYVSNQQYFALNLPIFNRIPFHNDVDKIVGDFTSVLLLEIDFRESRSFWRKVEKVQHKLINGLDHNLFNGVEFIRELSKFHNIHNKALMPYIFTSLIFDEIIDNEEIDDGFFDKRVINNDVFQTSQTYLDNVVSEINGQLVISWSYVTDLFSEDTIIRMMDYYLGVLNDIFEGVDSIEFELPEKEVNLINEYNDTDAEVPKRAFVNYFKEAVEKFPFNRAVEIKDQVISYKELDERSNRVANYLRSKSYGKNNLIGILTSRNIDTIVCILGIIKSGAAYLPLDPDYPKERRNYLIKDSNCSYVVENEFYEKNGISEYPDMIMEDYINLNDIAYVIYTSGSTGKPKGVVISHLSLINTITDINSRFKVNENDRILGFSSMCFDLSVYDIFGLLISGGSLVLVPENKDIKLLINTLVEKKVTIWNSVPSVMEIITDNIDVKYNNNDLRLVLLSGDWIPVKLPNKISKAFKNSEIISLGGATEGAIWSIYYPIKKVDVNWKSIPYGYPLANQKFYVLNSNKDLCPIGVEGELFIGGLGVAMGYLNCTELTDNAFMYHENFGYIYKTGDHGVFHKDGYIEFRGRKDQQIKIKGYRIEIGEIEHQILKIDQIKDVLVIANKENTDSYYLCAYITTGKKINVAEIREFLLNKIPEYMVPRYFILLEQFPLTLNGKIDRKQLPDPIEQISNEKENFISPKDNIDKKLLNICSEILNIEKSEISLGSGFFELGGDSIGVLKAITHLNKVFDVNISIREFYKESSLTDLKSVIEKRFKGNTQDDIKFIEKRECYSLSYAQRRFFMMQLMDKSSTHLNLIQMFPLPSDVKREKIEAVFTEIFKNHEGFRTYFNFVEGNPAQLIKESVEFEIKELNGDIKEVVDDFIRPHDLSVPPLIRVGIIENGLSYKILLVDVHHIITDGVSLDKLMKEFNLLYYGKSLSISKFQYKDFANWENQIFKNKGYDAHERFWINQLKNFEKVNLPIDFPYPKNKTYNGRRIHSELNENLSKELILLGKNQGITLYMTILSVYTLLLKELTGNLIINIGTVNLGRNNAELNEIIGAFVNQIVMRCIVNSEGTFLDHLQKIRTIVIESFNYQDFPFDRLKHKMQEFNVDLDVNVGFTLQNFTKYSEPEVDNVFRESINEIAPLDINMEGYQVDNKIKLDFIYNTDIFSQKTIESFINRLIHLFEIVLSSPNMMLSEIVPQIVLTNQGADDRLNEKIETEFDF